MRDAESGEPVRWSDPRRAVVPVAGASYRAEALPDASFDPAAAAGAGAGARERARRRTPSRSWNEERVAPGRLRPARESRPSSPATSRPSRCGGSTAASASLIVPRDTWVGRPRRRLRVAGAGPVRGGVRRARGRPAAARAARSSPRVTVSRTCSTPRSTFVSERLSAEVETEHGVRTLDLRRGTSPLKGDVLDVDVAGLAALQLAAGGARSPPRGRRGACVRDGVRRRARARGRARGSALRPARARRRPLPRGDLHRRHRVRRRRVRRPVPGACGEGGCRWRTSSSCPISARA